MLAFVNFEVCIESEHPSFHLIVFILFRCCFLFSSSRGSMEYTPTLADVDKRIGLSALTNHISCLRAPQLWLACLPYYIHT